MNLEKKPPSAGFFAFDAARGSFLAHSWGYLQQWHLMDEAAAARAHADRPPNMAAAAISSRNAKAASAPSNAIEWRLCTDYVAHERCVGFRCGLEFKMPMKTAAIGWFLSLSA